MSQRKSLRAKFIGFSSPSSPSSAASTTLATSATNTTTTTTTTTASSNTTNANSDKKSGRLSKTSNMFSCLSVKTINESAHQVNSNMKQLNKIGDCEAPTAQDVLEWTKSFENVMNQKAGRQVFMEFLRSEYSEENMLFWLACEELRQETDSDLIEEKARIIYDDYISILSPKEVSLDAQVRELINKKMIEPSKSTFDEAQLQIFTLMKRDSYPRFLASSVLKRLQQQHQIGQQLQQQQQHHYQQHQLKQQQQQQNQLQQQLTSNSTTTLTSS